MEYTIPKAAVSDGDVAPGEGDNFPLPDVMGTVLKDNGDTLTVSIASIAGQECAPEEPADDAGDQNPDPSDPAAKDKLMAYAKKADSKAGF